MLAVHVNPGGGSTTMSRWLIHHLPRGESGKNPGGIDNVKVGGAEFHYASAAHPAAQFPAEELVSIAHPQDGNVQIEQRGVTGWAAGGVHAGGTAGEDDALDPGEAGWIHIRREDLGENVVTADSVGDQMRVLAAKVQNSDALTHFGPPRIDE